MSTDKLILLFRRSVVPSSLVSGSPKVTLCCSFFSVKLDSVHYGSVLSVAEKERSCFFFKLFYR